MLNLATIAAAANYLRNQGTPQALLNPKPGTSAVVTALIAAEKSAKRSSTDHSLSDLNGTWKLGFITGTKKARQQAKGALGAGRFLPQFLNIRIAYEVAEPGSDRGTVCNSVTLGPLTLTLSGPIRFYPKPSVLAFDFTHAIVTMTGVEIYSGDMRGGRERAATFYDLPLKETAFFTYFAIDERYIAARGKGGGLALWTKVSSIL
ncbi:MAG: hypothetical protein AAGA40_19480 [Cyanobacteria bacterium P01_E01_bin.45]